MRPVTTALLSGTLFGAGLTLSQMTNPAKVIAFLDVAGSWDPSLAFVMAAALLVAAAANRIQQRRGGATNRPPSQPAASSASAASGVSGNEDGIGAGIDARLLAGAALFGIGWGLAGFCPGPALAAIVTGSPRVLIFVASMIVGMGLYQGLARAPLPRERATH